MKDTIKLFGNIDDISIWLKRYLNEHFRASRHTFFFDGIFHDVEKIVKIIPSENAFVVFKFTHTEYKLAKNGSHLPVFKGHIIFDYVTIQLFKLNNKSTELSFDINDTDSEFLNPKEISKLKDELLSRWGCLTTGDATDEPENSNEIEDLELSTHREAKHYGIQVGRFERWEKIKPLVNQLTIKAISQRFTISEATVKSDFRDMKKKGYI